MKAIQIDRHSKTDLSVKIKEVAIPQPADNEVLVKVKTAGVNPLDNMITRGEVKLIVPYAFPLTMGNEMAGVVEKVGRNVTDFKTGDRVFARLPLNKIGAFAEYVAVDKGALAHIPAYLSFAEAPLCLSRVLRLVSNCKNNPIVQRQFVNPTGVSPYVYVKNFSVVYLS